MSNKPNKARKTLIPAWVYLVTILLLALLLRLAGIWRTEPIDWHADEWVIAKPTLSLANNGQVGLKTHYKWSACSVIYSLGYSLYALKRWVGPYSYDNILIIQRVISAAAGTAAIFVVFQLIRKLFSTKAGLLAATLVAVAMLPAEEGHYGTVVSIVSLIIVSVMLLSYDLFDVSEKENTKLKAGRCCLLGLLCGWGIAAKWTILLAAIPISGAFFLSLWSIRRTGRLNQFVKINSKRIAIIIGMTAVAFLAGCPDIQFAPDKVIEGFNYEMQHLETGHYGGITIEEKTPSFRLWRTFSMLETCGNIYTLIAGIAATVLCLIRPTRTRVFLLWTMFAWLAVVFRNLVAAPRQHLVPLIVMLMLIAVALDVGTRSRLGRLRTACWLAFAFLAVGGILYTCITISPLWRPDPILECTKWIKANIPTDNGLTWAYLSGGDRSLAKIYPSKAPPGKPQYIIATHTMMYVFKKHPPERTIVPSEWFPLRQPPPMSTLMLYAEMNAGGGPNLSLVKEFYPKPSFLGLDSRLFLQTPGKVRIMASRGTSLFRLN